MILGSEEDFKSRRRCPSCRYGAARATDTKQEEVEGTIYKITYTLISCGNCKKDTWVESHSKDDYETKDYKSICIKKTGHSLSRNFYKGTTGKMAY